MIKRLLALAFLAATQASHVAVAQIIPCDTFKRGTGKGNELVQQYLTRPDVSYVRVCGVGKHQAFFSASTVVKSGPLCTYRAYQLFVNGKPSHLESAPAPAQLFAALSNGHCPPAESEAYVATNGVPESVVATLMKLWGRAVSSPQMFDASAGALISSPEYDQIRSIILGGHGTRLHIRSIERDGDRLIWKNYIMDVADPNHQDQFFVIHVSRWLGGFYRISGFGRGIY